MTTTLRIAKIKPAAIECVKATATGKHASNRQIANAVKLVEAGKVHRVDSDTLLVESQTEAGAAYELKRGQCKCACKWGEQGKVCAHRIAAALYICCTELPAPAPVVKPVPHPLMYTCPLTGRTMIAGQALDELYG